MELQLGSRRILTLTCLQFLNQHKRLCLPATEIALTSNDTGVLVVLDGPVLHYGVVFFRGCTTQTRNAVQRPNAKSRLVYIWHLDRTTTQLLTASQLMAGWVWSLRPGMSEPQKLHKNSLNNVPKNLLCHQNLGFWGTLF